MYTQLNQYYVVMEVEPKFWQNPDGLNYLYVGGNNDQQVPLSAFTHCRCGQHPARGESPGTVPLRHHFLQSADGTLAQRRRPAHRTGGARNRPAVQRFTAASRAPRKPIRTSLERTDPDRGGADRRLHRAGRLVRESDSSASPFFPRCPRRAWARCWRCMVTHNELNVISLIGIILLIGIVKKNAIMMIDFAIAAERNEGLPPKRPFSTPACCASVPSR